jgi:hypothetical protein
MRFRFAFVVFVALAAFGCSADSPAQPSGPVVIERIEIQSAEVTVGATRPAQVTTRVVGTLGSGCDYLHSIEQRREGGRVTIEIKRSRFTEGPCTTILKEFRQELGLPEAFPPGDYTLRVNDVSKAFSVS